MRNLTKLFAASAILLGLVLTTSAQDFDNELTEIQVKNLINGINSDNPGVRKSASYFVGKYRVEEAIPAIKKVLFDKNDETTGLILLNTLGQFRYDKVQEIFGDFADYTTNERLKQQALSFYIYYDQDVKVLANN